jgi:hypothetical protein
VDLRRSRHFYGELCGRGRESNEEERIAGPGHAGIGGGCIVGMDCRLIGVVLLQLVLERVQQYWM